LACYDGTKVVMGSCSSELKRSNPEAGAAAAEVAEASLWRLPGTTDLITRVALTHNRMPVSSTKIVSKLSCLVAGKKIVDIKYHYVSSLVSLSAGESTLTAAKMYTGSWLDLSETPTRCEFSITQSLGSLSAETADTLLYQGCFDDETLVVGKCPDFESATPAATPTKNSVVIDRVEIDVMERSEVQSLDYTIDVTVADSLPWGWLVMAEAKCKAKSGTMVSTAKIRTQDLDRLVPGETSRGSGVANGRDELEFQKGFQIDAQPCEVAFFLSPRPKSGRGLARLRESWVPLKKKVCYHDGNITDGRCRR